MIIVPILITDYSIISIILNFLLMHWVAGFILSCIFQPAHVMESSTYSNVEGDSNIPNDWATNQVLNTVNFAPKAKAFTWFVGGLNYQVEHHLFPSICHVHYTKLSKIVKETAEEFNLPYHVQPTFISALWYHMKMLKQLGKA
jgi:linoleoyl-CoA desaturase